jgi:signal transduction histidine kinase
MSGLESLRDWFAGNGRYMDLVHCMGHDRLWIAITVALDFTVAGGYALIALHWWKNQRDLPDSPAKRALGTMRNIFLFCGICGYLFIPIKMVWPAWRLYDIVMVVLCYYTWRYALGARDLKVVYNELGRSAKLKEDLEASREESRRKSFFLNAVSHDLRTPLNGLLLQTNLAELSATNGDLETMTAALRDIKAGARVAADLLDGLLEYARLEAGADGGIAEPVEVGTAVDNVIAACSAAAAQKGLYLRANVPIGLAVHCDRQRLERILANLVTNAVKFTDEGGVRIEVDRGGNRDGAFVRLHVIDTGIGIAPEHRDRLFDEFFQVDNAERNRGKGFGLGLAIARRLARQRGGDVTVESAVGHGSRFTVTLPAAPALSTAALPAAAASSTTPCVAPEGVAITS